jgi:nicotinate-nucleotide pyrophosphorylase (carboxylating)
MAMEQLVRTIVAEALSEDIGSGDITSELVVPAEAMAEGRFLAKEAGVLSGLDICEECFSQLDDACVFEALCGEGDAFTAGTDLARIRGRARALLAAERTALNFLQRLCGIATLTREFSEAVRGTGAQIVDTRKTTPRLRVLEKRAVKVGGGHNHRFALYDGILLKDNHIELVGGVKAAVAAARAGRPHTLKVEVEVTNLEQLVEAIEVCADIVMLDNMSIEELSEAVKVAAGQVITEASGGVGLETVAAIAATGVDLISVGALTHSAPAIDISLEITGVGVL